MLLLLSSLVSCAGIDPGKDIENYGLLKDGKSDWTAVEDFASSASSEAVLGGWIQDFSTPTLDALVAEGLLHNLDLQVATVQLRASKARLRQATALRLPMVNGQGTASKSESSIENSDGSVTTTRNTSYNVSLGVSWELDLWGRLSAGQKASGAEFLASQADYDALRLLTVAQIVQAWYGVIEAEEQRALSAQAVRSYTKSLAVIKGRFNRGLASGLDLRLAMNQLSNEQARAENRQRAALNASRSLEVLVGRYPKGEIDAAGSLPALDTVIPSGLPSDLLKRRPDIVAAKARLSSAGFKTKAAQRALFPSLSLTGSLGTASDEMRNIFNPNFSFWNLAAGVTQPLFQGGRLRAEVTVKKANEAEAFIRYKQAVQRAFKEVEEKLYDIESLKRQRFHIEQSAIQAIAAEKTALRTYGRGVTSILSLLDAQRRSFNAKSELLSLRRAQIDSRVALYLALGGGFESPNAGVNNDKNSEINDENG